MNIIIGLIFSLIFSTNVVANERRDRDKLEVQGIVRDSNNKKIAGAQVTVTCNSHTKTTQTNRHGSYEVKFAKKECHKRDTVTVNASYGGEAGTESKNAHDEELNINLRLAAVSVPEFSAYTGLLALLCSVGTFIFLKNQDAV